MDAWGKTNQEGFHPLAHHCMDVAAVFERLLKLPVMRDRLKAAADARLTDAICERLAALVFLHDIGKLHPGFQAKGWQPGMWSYPTRDHLKEGWAFLELAAEWPQHPFHETMEQIMEWGEAVVPLFSAVIAHHGRPVKPPPAPILKEWPCLSHYDWQTETGVMCAALHRWFAGAFEPGGAPLSEKPQFHHAIAGLVSLADWIGSDTRLFRFTDPFDLAQWRVMPHGTHWRRSAWTLVISSLVPRRTSTH